MCVCVCVCVYVCVRSNILQMENFGGPKYIPVSAYEEGKLDEMYFIIITAECCCTYF